MKTGDKSRKYIAPQGVKLVGLKFHVADMAESKTTGLFKVLRASAGSGKTYQLVREYLRLALGSVSPDYYKHILAITFTNAAAAEMKERVILRLKELAEGSCKDKVLVEYFKSELGIDDEQLTARSAAAYRHILHNYGQLSIQTIDGFTHRLIRSFARELNLNQDFSVEMDTDSFDELVADHCLDAIGTDKDITAYLEAYALENLEEGSNWNIRQELVKFSKQLRSEESNRALKKLSGLKLEDFKRIKSALFQKRKAFEKRLKDTGEAGVKLLSANNLEPSDFRGGQSSAFKIFATLSKEEIKPPTATLKKLQEGELSWYLTKTDASIVQRIEHIRPQLQALLDDVVLLFSPGVFGEYKLYSLILNNIYSTGLMSVLFDNAEELKSENNILLISDFHRLVNEVVRDSPAPFIYERMGYRYRHILIDEFQDTSVLQWTNAIPLIENSLSESNMSLLVGDAKQSIYRWRGGRAEQFVNLPDVKTDEEKAHSNSLPLHYQEEILETNYRSAKAIVDFNNRFYEALAPALNKESIVYDKLHQAEHRKEEGYVQIDCVTEAKKEERWQQTLTKILEIVQDCLADGYRPCDINILTRKGYKEAGVIANYLASNNVSVVTLESFLLSNSAQVRVVMANLCYLSDPQKKFPAIDLIQSLAEINPKVSVQDFIKTYTKREKRKLIARPDDYLNTLYPKMADESSSVYGMAISIIERFGLQVDAYLESLLDNIRNMTVTKNMSLSAFIEWWDVKKEDLYISSAENEDSVRIMTIHKSKGLQFPVVIYPRIASPGRQNEIWIDTDEEKIGLPVALVKQRAIKEDEDIQWPPEFYTEEEKKHLDDMNLCYVATTRAEDRLYMIHEMGKGNANSWLSRQINETLNKDFAEQKEDERWTFGSLSKEENTKKEKAASSEMISVSPAPALRQTLQLRATRISDDFNEEVFLGNIIHKTLAEIQGEDAVLESVAHTARLYQLSESQSQKLLEDVTGIIRHPDFSKWFTKDANVISERDICTAEGMIIRPDRVVQFANHVDVIDFKTGETHERYKKQVSEYIRHLKELYKLPVRGYLLYTRDKEMVEVEAE